MQIGHLRQRYLWGPAVDQILAEEAVDGGTADLVQWTLTDHLNTVRDIAKYDPQTGTTTVVNHLLYDAFGRVTAETNPPVDSLFLFTARPFDEDTQLQNNLNRWYDYRVGRWLSEEPAVHEAGDSDLYRHVFNNPVVYVDPTGLIPPGWDSPTPGIPLPGHGFPPTTPGAPWFGGSGVPAQPADPRYSPGFKICHRKIQKGNDCCENVAIAAINLCFDEHCYLQYGALNADGTPSTGTEGWGIGGGNAGALPVPEQHFHPASCSSLRKGKSPLKYGAEAGKAGSDATDAEINDCISKVPMSKDYVSWGRGRYNCMDWAKEAAAACGLE